MVRFGFKELALERIEAGVYSGNDGSEKVLIRTGFSYEGLARKFTRAKSTGEWHDCKMYGLLREDWQAIVTER